MIDYPILAKGHEKYIGKLNFLLKKSLFEAFCLKKSYNSIQKHYFCSVIS